MAASRCAKTVRTSASFTNSARWAASSCSRSATHDGAELTSPEAGAPDGGAPTPLDGVGGGRGTADGRGGPCDGLGRGGTRGTAEPKRVKLPEPEAGGGWEVLASG